MLQRCGGSLPSIVLSLALYGAGGDDFAIAELLRWCRILV